LIVPEKAFLDFKSKCGFEFVKEEKQESVFFYENRHRNGGGISLHYDAGKKIMTGSYSHH